MPPEDGYHQLPSAPNQQLYRFCLTAEPMAVRATLGEVVARFSERLSPRNMGVLELALAEVLNNIAEHAYDGTRGRIDLTVELRHGAVICHVIDRGRAMPGLAPPPARAREVFDVHIDTLPEGGWGWHLIHGLTDDLAYRRAGGKNRLMFRIDLSPEAKS